MTKRNVPTDDDTKLGPSSDHRQPPEEAPCRCVFVFGSNLAGRHGAGAAKFALERHGAVYGQGEGLQGSAYAIPTKDRFIKTRRLDDIALSVQRFLTFAREHPNYLFQVTRIGCGLAGYDDPDIAPMFAGATANCVLPDGWRAFSGRG